MNMTLEKCSYCGRELKIPDFHFIFPKDPALFMQCQPFMEMLYVCDKKECIDKCIEEYQDKLPEGTFEND